MTEAEAKSRHALLDVKPYGHDGWNIDVDLFKIIDENISFSL